MLWLIKEEIFSSHIQDLLKKKNANINVKDLLFYSFFFSPEGRTNFKLKCKLIL